MKGERLLCDAMLGTLTRLLRIMGFDTAYADSGASDADVMAQALKEGRVLVTRDFELSRRVSSAGGRSLLVRDLPADQQLAIVLTHLGLPLHPDRFYTRCTLCNGVLKVVEAETVAAEVPEGVLARQERFSRCTECGKVYWEGTHVADLDVRLRQVIDAVQGGGGSAAE